MKTEWWDRTAHHFRPKVVGPPLPPLLPTTFVTGYRTAETRRDRASTAGALPADMDADNTQSTPVRAAGVTEDWLAGLETPGGIRGGPEAVVDAEDAHNGDGALEAVGSAGLGNGSSGGFARDPTQNHPSDSRKSSGSRRGLARRTGDPWRYRRRARGSWSHGGCGLRRCGEHEVAGSAGQVLRAAGAPRCSSIRPQPRPAGAASHCIRDQLPRGAAAAGRRYSGAHLQQSPHSPTSLFPSSATSSSFPLFPALFPFPLFL